MAADAIHVVRETVATDAFAWTPAIPSAGSYDLYARWTASSANSAAASYTVVHGAGTDVVTVNQKQNGGQWRYLGSYGFEPDAGHQVTLTAASDGAVVADAIRLVGTGPAPSDVIYVHADPLGTPQKLTDAARAIVWDRVQDPFGRQVSLAAGPGMANPLRFPGQLFDAETGFHYNYFRDYDPSTGRYIQSDPIGLGGGINTFAYVGGNPIGWIDPWGLIKLPTDPSGLPNDWTRDPTHRNPNGSRWRNPDGGCLEFEPGQPGKPGWREKPHWHDCSDPNDKKRKRKHRQPGEECPQPGEESEPSPFSIPELPEIPVPLVPGGGGGGGKKCITKGGYADPFCKPGDFLGVPL